MPAVSGVDRALIDQIIDEAAVFSSEVLAPTRTAGDAGCTLRDGRVFLPPGFADAYRQVVDAGWPALACGTEHGGDRKSTRLNYSHKCATRKTSSACKNTKVILSPRNYNCSHLLKKYTQ